MKYKPLRIHLEVFETVFSSFVLSLQCGKKETKKKGEDDKLFLRIRISDYLKSNSVLTAYLSNESIPSIDLSLSW